MIQPSWGGAVKSIYVSLRLAISLQESSPKMLAKQLQMYAGIVFYSTVK